MTLLELPKAFEGKWRNLLILTYGANLPFFENSILRVMNANCRKKIILADSKQFLQSCAQYAQYPAVRHLNQKYLVDGISIPHAAHAKLILLTNQEAGRLLVGSGNLGMDGYASGGEIFTQYEYNAKEMRQLNAFLSAWDFVEFLIARGYIGPAAIPYLRHLHAESPWLFRSPLPDWNSVRSNLSHSFLNQVKAAIGNEKVEEAWVHAPFFDENATALENFLDTISPNKLVIFVQPGKTSLDPQALTRVLSNFQGQARIRPVRLKEDDGHTLIHAKFYLVKTKTRAICLQGSPNCSQTAMLLSPPHGNIELANLFIGKPGEFDYLINNFSIGEDIVDFKKLDISFRKAENPESTQAALILTGATWQGDKIILNIKGDLSELISAKIKIGEIILPLNQISQDESTLEASIPPEHRHLLTAAVPISLFFDGENTFSNPVFAWNAEALEREMLGDVIERPDLDKVGNLSLEDEEIERWLGELEAALVFDRRSVWQLAGRPIPKTAEEDDEPLQLTYADVDYEQIRRHPRIIPYLEGNLSQPGQNQPKSRLQIILSAITDHFKSLEDIAFNPAAMQEAQEAVERAAEQEETEQEKEANESEKLRKQRIVKARVRIFLKNFIKRYVRGLQSADFIELAGPHVMAKNYVIFTHILWLLFSRDLVETEFIIQTFLKIWLFFWGGPSQKGFCRLLPENEKQGFLKIIQEEHSDCLIFATIYYSALIARSEGLSELQFALRDFLRHLLVNPVFEIDENVIQNSWVLVSSYFPFNPPTPDKITEEFSKLTYLENQNTFLGSIETAFGYPKGSCAFVKQEVFREYTDRNVSVVCLVIDGPQAISTPEIACAIIARWDKFYPREFYRLIGKSVKRVVTFDRVSNKGYYFLKHTPRGD